MSAAAALTALGVILAVELPDKTLVATVVLATRYRPLPVLAGVTVAFAVQCGIAVTAGRLLNLLPERLVAGVVAVLFAVGAFLLLRADHDEPESVSARREVRGWRQALAAFGVIFAAEWGDASQLATAGLTARYDDALAVFLGSFVALVSIAALAVTLGQWVTRKVPLVLISRAAGVIFIVLAVLAAIEAIKG